MKKGDTITIYQDGKSCRGIDATVIGLRANGIQVRFNNMDDEEIIAWSRQRNRNGKYEVIGWNYWIMKFNK